MATIEVLFEREELERGAAVTVPIVWTLDKPTKVRSVYAEFRGAEVSNATYTVSTTDSKGRSRTETRTATQYHDIVRDSFLLAGHEKLDFFATVRDSFALLLGGGKHVQLEPGDYRYEVSFTVPDGALATMQGKNCRVFYELRVRVDRPWAKDHKAVHTFTVPPQLDRVDGEAVVVRYPEDKGKGFWDKMFGKRAKLRLALQNNRFAIGDNVHGLIQIEPDEEFRFRKVTARLIGLETTRAQGHTDSYRHQQEAVVLSDSCDVSPLDGWSSEFDLPVQDVGPASVTATNFSIDWFVEVEVDVAWAKDPRIRAPITIFHA